MLILAIESSCDDTAAAVVSAPDLVLSNIISSQFEVHAPFGGIVPELASRAHIEAIRPLIEQALARAEVSLDDIDLIAATQGPGLVGSLLVGFTFAKALALVKDIPCVGVDHMAGHLLSALLLDDPPSFPYTALVVSGGNTSLFCVNGHTDFTLMGRTRDDAAGEAFDKVAKLLALGYPGGPAVSASAHKGDPAAFAFPRAWLDKDSLDFSFSGLKTSVVNTVHTFKQREEQVPVADICASFEQAVIEVLVAKTLAAARRNGHRSIVLGGGVACNRELRRQLLQQCRQNNIQLFVPDPVFCTDNAAMIALAGYYRYQQGKLLEPDDDAYSRSPLN